MSRKNNVVRFILFVSIVVVFIAAIYFTFFFSYTCDDEECFISYQEKCARTDYISDDPETTWFYHIVGDKKGICEIEVEVLQVKKGTLENKGFEGKKMTCFSKLGTSNAPESDLSSCHGELKEDLQNLIIQRLHNYIVENLGQIDEELSKI